MADFMDGFVKTLVFGIGFPETDFKIVFFIFVNISVVVSFGSPLFFLTLGKMASFEM